jgi:hypothetical protein
MYQYGTFSEAFIRIESYSGKHRWSDDASSRIDMCGGFGSLDRDANFTRMKTASDLSVSDFQRSFYTYRRPFWKTPVLRRCISENRRVGGLLMRIGDANFTQLNTPLNLSIRRFQRRFYTYRRQFWQAPVVRRCFLKEQAFMSFSTVMCHQRWLHCF